MSGSADSAPAGAERDALARLEAAVARSVERIRALEAELLRAGSGVEAPREARPEPGGEGAAADRSDRSRALERENEELRRRLEEGREGIRRLLAKIRFLEEQR